MLQPPSPSRRGRHRLPAHAARGVLLVLAGALAGCGRGDPGATAAEPAGPATPAPAASPAGTAPAPVPPTVAGPAAIAFDRLVHDFGLIPDSKTQRATFTFTNTGTGRLVIQDVKAACGCTVPSLSKYQYAPGESGELKIEFDPKTKQGRTDKQITVVSNAQPDSTVTLRLTSDIRSLLHFEQFHRMGILALGEEHRAVVPLRTFDPDLKILGVSVNDPFIDAEVLTSGEVDAEPDGETVYRSDVGLTIRADRPWGLLYATKLNVRVYGRWQPGADPTESAYNVYLIGRVFGEIHAVPAVCAFGKVAPGTSFRKEITLRRVSGAPFEILGAGIVDATMPGVSVVVPPGRGSQHKVLVHGTCNRHGSLKGVLVVETDVPGEERLQIPIHGLIQS